MRSLLAPLFAAGAILVGAGSARAAVALKVPFGNHMVLQRDRPIAIWGTAAAGEQVTVTLGGQSRSVKAGAGGSWSVALDPMKAGGPYALVAKGGANSISLSDVFVGEVWHCAGQSNMDTRLNYSEYAPALGDSAKVANYPRMRYLTMRQPNQTIQWQQVTPATAGPLSAMAYFFGREIFDHLDSNIAVGLVVTAVGGTIIEQWLDPATLKTIPDLAASADAGTMYNQWIAPVAGYGVRGTVWVQGENNTSSALYAKYGARLAKLIPGWRAAWGQPDMPFLVGGLCHKGAYQTAVGETSNQASIREQQRAVTDTMPNTWLSALVDVGSETTWHYPQKPTAGRRLGKLARGAVYRHRGFAYEHPRPRACFSRGTTIVVPFDTRGSRIALASGTAPTGFAVASSDGKWSWASARLSGDTILLSTSIANPTQVEYAWANNPVMNLQSSAGLPATPFRMAIASNPPPVGISADYRSRLAAGDLRIETLPGRLIVGAHDRALRLRVSTPSGRLLTSADLPPSTTPREIDVAGLPRGIAVVDALTASGARSIQRIVVH